MVSYKKSHMKTLMPFLLLLLLVGSCRDEKVSPTGCGSDELPWLEAKVNEIRESSLTEYFYFVQAQYESKTVFLLQNCCPHCGTIVPVYDCSGTLIGHLGPGDIDPTQVSEEIVVWRPDNSACDL